MARYKWNSPHDWLGDKINAYIATLDNYILRGKGTADDANRATADLAYIANGVVNGTFKIDADTIQDVYQSEMDDDGYFNDLDAVTVPETDEDESEAE